MLASIPYDDHYHNKHNQHNTDEVQFYSQSMSKHHHNQYTKLGDIPRPVFQHQYSDEHLNQQHMGLSLGQGQSQYPHPNHHQQLNQHPPPPPPQHDYYFDQGASSGNAGAGTNPMAYFPVPYDIQLAPEYPNAMGYMQPNTSASQFSHTSSLSSPSLEHPALGTSTSLAGSLPSPYSKDHPDMLAAMRNRTHSWSSRSSRKSRAFSYDGKWSMPYEPQMGINFPAGTGDNDQLVSPLVGSIEDHYGDAAAAAAAAAAAGERMRANSHPPYLYSPTSHVQHTAGGVISSAAGIQASSRPRTPHLDRHSSYGSLNNSDGECYSPTNAAANNGDDFDDRRSKKSAVCPVCNKVLKRDLTRHMRTHEETARFICPFPRSQCPHKRGQFNRPYDYKKHLLHHHFQFDKAKVVRRFRDLQSKLTCRGSCPCGQGNFTAAEWLDNHVLGGQICPLVHQAPDHLNSNEA